MQFGDKIKAARQAAEMTQEALAEKVGVSRRTIMLYETNRRKPKNAATIISLAKALNVGSDYFLTDDELKQIEEQETFLEQAGEKYGNRGKAQARLLLDQASALFAGGELSEDDKEAFFQTITQIYFDAKSKAKKYTPIKYRDDDNN
ncbi:MAG: helix-turn-helix transcriptional regulator [Oscillospiraceae bacterium]|nr:helix-turn-helix transcriptional regulator [Oscillospiraceae bacterium]